LFFQLDALEGEEVFGAEDGVAEGAVGVVELRGSGERGLLGFRRLGGEAVGMELAGLGVEGLLEGCEIEV
jgi:hypothetical protein